MKHLHIYSAAFPAPFTIPDHGHVAFGITTALPCGFALGMVRAEMSNVKMHVVLFVLNCCFDTL